MDLNDLIKNPEQIQTLINVLQSLLPKEEKEAKEKEKEIKATTQNKNIKTKGQRKKANTETYENKFEKMSEFAMHKDDIAIDKALSKHPPVGRMREFEMVDAICRICGKKETINPSLLFDSKNRYKCNNCSTQAG